MPTATLTARSVAALKTDEPQTDVWDTVVKGLGLRVNRAGTKTYFVRYRANGKQRRQKIGRHPTLNLADARIKAGKIMGAAQAGEDPAQDERERKSTDSTFAALAAEVVEAYSTGPDAWRPKTLKERKRIIDSELLPAWGKLPAASIKRRDVLQLVERIQKRAPVMANRTLATIKMIYNVGIKREFPTIESNPAHLLEATDEAARSRYLTREEMRAVWNATALESPIAKGVLRLTLLTAQRVGSVAAMRWADIDQADVWHIPAEAFKGKRAHLVPLSKEARDVLAELRPLTGKGECVFPGRGNGALPHFNGKNKVLQRMREDLELPNWTIHDFRTTFRTHATRPAKPNDKRDAAGLGVAAAIADAVLGHKEKSVGFDHYTAEPERYLLSEKRDALNAWGKFVLAATRIRA